MSVAVATPCYWDVEASFYSQSDGQVNRCTLKDTNYLEGVPLGKGGSGVPHNPVYWITFSIPELTQADWGL